MLVLPEDLRDVFAGDWSDRATLSCNRCLLVLAILGLLLGHKVVKWAISLAVTDIRAILIRRLLDSWGPSLCLLDVINDWVSTLETLGSHKRLVVFLVVYEVGRRSWKMINTNVAFNCIVLLEAGVSWLHQALRIDLAVVLIFPRLELWSDQRGFLLIVLHDLMDRDSSIVTQLNWSSTSNAIAWHRLLVVLVLIFFNAMHILSCTMLQHIHVIEEILLRLSAWMCTHSLSRLNLGRGVQFVEWVSFVVHESKLIGLLVIEGSRVELLSKA